MITKVRGRQSLRIRARGFALVLACLVIFILSVLGLGLLTIAYGARLRAIMMKNETMAKMTAEAGYENAIDWMSGLPDPLGSFIQTEGRGRRGPEKPKPVEETDSVTIADSHCDYSISFDHFLDSRPIYRIESTGYCGQFSRKIVAFVVQAVSGWDIGSCRMPTQFVESIPVDFAGSDVVDIPIHINCYAEPDDSERDIHISTEDEPTFTQPVSVGESRYKSGGGNNDKYAEVIGLFKDGIYFDQPASKITNQDSIARKATRFRRSTLNDFNFSRSRLTNSEPRWNDDAVPDVTNGSWEAAVQLEFYTPGEGGPGRVRITNHCTVRCFQGGPYDYMMIDSAGNYTRYNIYGYHYVNEDSRPVDCRIKKTYVVYKVATSSKKDPTKPKTAESEPGGQIFVEGNVIIGGEVRPGALGGWEIKIGDKWHPSKVEGRLTVVATGNIWIISPIEIEYDDDDAQDRTPESFSVPAADNSNVLGLFSQSGVVRIVDPGLSSSGEDNPGDENNELADLDYRPVGGLSPSATERYHRYLPDPMVVQAAITVGGGGWGAENVGARLNNTNTSGLDSLIFTGSIAEAVRGPVAEVQNGFKMYYYFDQRFQDGILPGDMWLQSKFVPTPGGWTDY